jgi:hypothetical protein
MARLRARKRLTAAMDRVAAAFGGIQLGWRRAGTWFQTLKPAGESLLPVMVGVASVMGAATFAPSPGLPTRSLDQPHRMVRIENISASRSAHRKDGPARSRSDRATNRSAVEAAPVEGVEAQPTPKPSPSENTVVDTQHAQARTQEGQGYKGVEVCTGEGTSDEADDHSNHVTIYDGSQTGEEDTDTC